MRKRGQNWYLFWTWRTGTSVQELKSQSSSRGGVGATMASSGEPSACFVSVGCFLSHCNEIVSLDTALFCLRWGSFLGEALLLSVFRVMPVLLEIPGWSSYHPLRGRKEVINDPGWFLGWRGICSPIFSVKAVKEWCSAEAAACMFVTNTIRLLLEAKPMCQLIMRA